MENHFLSANHLFRVNSSNSSAVPSKTEKMHFFQNVGFLRQKFAECSTDEKTSKIRRLQEEESRGESRRVEDGRVEDTFLK